MPRIIWRWVAILVWPHFLVFNRTQGKPLLVGGCGIGRREDGSLELGYWIARPYWGLGFATEGDARRHADCAFDRPQGQSGAATSSTIPPRAA